MGWTGLYDKPKSIPEFFKSQWERQPSDGKDGLRCLGQAFVGRFTLYGVWESYDEFNVVLKRFATVTLIRYSNGPQNDCAWYYKDMDETVGPCERSCPKTLLKLLNTPAHNAYARAWRKACWQNALGLTRSSRITQARRVWKRNRAKAVELLNDWNDKHPSERIEFKA